MKVFPEIKISAGFTLIEVLIALAILSIALTAIMKVTSQNIRDTTYLENKTIAHYVALDVMNTARAGLINLPKDNDKVDNDTVMLNKDWHWVLSMAKTPTKNIRKIKVEVFNKDNDPFADLTSYIYVSQTK